MANPSVSPKLHVEGVSKLCSARYVLVYLAFIGCCVAYLLRDNVNLALVAMVKPSPSETPGSAECSSTNTSHNDHSMSNSTVLFVWDKALQGQVLGSFFYGYTVTQIPGGWMAGRYGGKLLFGLGILCTAVFSLVTPIAARWNVYALIVVRIIEGLGEGVTFPAIISMWGVWSPPLESSSLVMYSFTGAGVGTIIGMPLSGLIIDHLGWEYVFYIFGVIGCVWFLIWMILVYDTPKKHPRISQSELEYITTGISSQQGANKRPVHWSETPWREILLSKEVWGIIVSMSCHNWGFYTLLTCLPTYLSDVLRFDITQNGLISALPQIFMGILTVLAAYIADELRRRHLLTTTAVRKLWLAIGLLIPAACLVGIGYVGCDYILAVVLLCIAGGFDGVAQASCNVNQLDLSPKLSGTLFGISNTIGSIPGFLAPIVVGWITEHRSNSATWRNVFYISAEIYIFGVIFFTILGSGEEQDWSIKLNQSSERDIVDLLSDEESD